MRPWWHRRRKVVIPKGRTYVLLREQPLYRRGFRQGVIEACCVIAGLGILGWIFRGVLG
jgi:hypothetical protein